MTVLELMQYLQAQCFRGNGDYIVRFAKDPHVDQLEYVAPFSTLDSTERTCGYLNLSVDQRYQQATRAAA